MLSCYPRLLRFCIEQDIQYTNRTYMKTCVEIPHRKKVTMKNQLLSLIFPLFLMPFLLSDLNETSYIEIYWDGICEVWIFLNSPLPSSKIFPLFLTTFPLSDLYETSYIDSLWDGNCEVSILFLETSPLPHIPWIPPSLLLKPLPLFFKHFPIVRFGWNFLYRFILGWHMRH